jgi:hypothetical protein
VQLCNFCRRGRLSAPGGKDLKAQRKESKPRNKEMKIRRKESSLAGALYNRSLTKREQRFVPKCVDNVKKAGKSAKNMSKDCNEVTPEC